MLSLRYLLCFIILLDAETCFHITPTPSPSVTVTCCSASPSLTTNSNTSVQKECFSPQEMTRKTREKAFKEVLKSLYEKMKDKNIINISLLCSTVFVVGVSLNIPVPFYPKEALHKGVSVTQSGTQTLHEPKRFYN